MHSHSPPAGYTRGSPPNAMRTSEERGEGSSTMSDAYPSRRGGAKTHAPTTSVGSSVSFYTVRSSAAFSSPLTTSLGLEHADEVDECRTPTPADMFRIGEGGYGSPHADREGGVRRARPDESSELGGVEEEVEQGEGGDGEGYEIKCLPNGMRRLPSPSIASRSCDHSAWASPLSQPLALALAPAAPQMDQHCGGRPLLGIATAHSAELCDESDESGTTTSNTRSRPRSSMTTPPRNVTPTSKPTTTNTTTTATATTTSASGSWPTRPSSTAYSFSASASGDSTDWGSNFWCVVQDPLSPANTFFANPTTGECRWLLPRGTIVLPPSGEGEWWELLDEASGREYYYHTQTRESRWVRPGPEAGMVIPMRAVQMSRHIKRSSASEAVLAHAWLEPGQGEDRLGQLKDSAADRVEQDPSAMVVTPLRPRTKSLARAQRRDRTTQTSRSTLRPPAAPTTATPPQTPGEGERDGLAQKARRSILLSDQRALSLARKTSTPPFKPETLPAPPLFKPRRRYRPSTTGTPRKPPQQRGSVSTSKTYPFLTPASEMEESEEPVPIRKVGKGLAHDPRSQLKQQRSLPFLRDPPKSEKSRPLTTIPFAITHALVNLGLDCSLHPNSDDQPSKDRDTTTPTHEPKQQSQHENQPKTQLAMAGEKPSRKLTRLVRFARCRATSGVSMHGGTHSSNGNDGDG